jgi:PAS domain S-box-containing protein
VKRNSTIYQRLFESANAPILIINSDFKFVDCNNMALSILNCSKDYLIGKTPDDILISPKYQPNGELSSELGKKYFTSAMQGNDMKFEWTHLKKNGSELIVEISLFGFNASGKENFFAMWRDLTEIRTKENQLKESEERFRTIFSKATDSMLLHSSNLKEGITHCNEAAYKKLGYESAEGILGKSILDFSPEYQTGGVKTAILAEKNIKESLSNGQTEFEWIHLKKDNTPIWFDIVLTKFSFGGKIYIHSVWRDITEKKMQQTELEKYRNHLEELVEIKTKDLKNAQAQLIQSEKMASLGVLTAGVAHEINNPLNYIMGGYVGLSNELDEEGNIKSANTATFLEGIKIGIDRAADIVKGLNQLSRDNENYNEICDIHSIIDNCLSMLHNKHKKRIGVVKSYYVENAKIKGNAGKFHQVFLNIILNAIDAIEESGTISIVTNSMENILEVIIEDTGCGIPKDNLNKIADPFFTTKDPGKGTGLGLSITSTIIHAHRGKIKFHSEENKGTKVTIHLPKNM